MKNKRKVILSEKKSSVFKQTAFAAPQNLTKDQIYNLATNVNKVLI